MVKFIIIFYQPDSVMKFENMYNDLLALIERMPGITRRQVVNVLGTPTGPASTYRILEVYFEDEAQMRAALMSPRGQEAGAELTTRFPRGSYEMLYAQVYEEAGGSTPSVGAPASASDADELANAAAEAQAAAPSGEKGAAAASAPSAPDEKDGN